MDELNQISEDFLKSVYRLEKTNAVSTNDLANELDVSPSSVTKMVKRLAESGYLEYISHRGVRLTAFGRKHSLRVIRRQRLVELFLVKILNYTWDEVYHDANVLEHYISERFEDALFHLLGEPTHDPHGDPIPSKDGILPESYPLSLLEVAPNTDVVVRRIKHEDPQLLQYVEKMGLLPNTGIKVLELQPFGGSLRYLHNHEEKMIGREAAASIFVSEGASDDE